MARIFFFKAFSVFQFAVGETLAFLAAKENLTIKEFGSVGNAKCRRRDWLRSSHFVVTSVAGKIEGSSREVIA
jgi:hypothetical protein